MMQGEWLFQVQAEEESYICHGGVPVVTEEKKMMHLVAMHTNNFPFTYCTHTTIICCTEAFTSVATQERQHGPSSETLSKNVHKT